MATKELEVKDTENDQNENNSESNKKKLEVISAIKLIEES